MTESTQFSIEKTGDICKVEVLSHLASAPLTIKFKELIDNLILKDRCKKILFDLSRVEFIDSSFLGAIVYAYKNLIKTNGKIACVVKSASVSDRFLISQLDKLFNIYSNSEDASKYLQE